MAEKKAISDDIREQVIAKVNAFNQTQAQSAPPPSARTRLMQKLLGRPSTTSALPAGSYVPRFKGAYLYLDRIDFRGQPFAVCRLKWTGNMDAWEFAIYRYSREAYDPEEWFFDGAEKVDGTVEGAMRAGMAAYPL